MAGVQGHTVRVLQLSADQVREIAGFYWVERVDALLDSDLVWPRHPHRGTLASSDGEMQPSASGEARP